MRRSVEYLGKTKLRFMSKVTKAENGCWIWHGALDQDGYGRFMLDARRSGNRKVELAHRAAWLLFVGPLPEWKAPDWIGLDHFKCDTPGCVNPEHLKLATVQANAGRGKRPYSGVTHCKNNHRLPPKKPGARQRVCLICKRDTLRRLRERNATIS